MRNKFYITTSIAYTNAPPHIGYALELIQADVLARHNKLLKKDVFFLTGTDEHGIKIVKAAEAAKKKPDDFTNEISAKFRELTKALNLSNTDFIRTIDQKRHWPAVEKAWKQLRKNEDIYKKKYKGLYCVGCEAFVKEKDLVQGKCPNHLQEPEIVEEENYFFKLSNYAQVVKKALLEDRIKIIPSSRKNEILSFIEQGVEDLSCSRSKANLKWGIPVPGDDSQIIYIWFEALINYISALDYGKDGAKFKRYWPADVHCVGKDIFRFHALIWPAMLFALKLELPRSIFVHGYITSGGQKMSKSLGNVIDPFETVSRYGADPLRYFLLREIPPTEDGDFTYARFEERYNSDLASGLGNLAARVITLAGKLKESGDSEFKNKTEETRNNFNENIESFKFNEALASLWELISFCDKYIEEKKPWEQKENKEEVIGNLIFAVSQIAEILKPAMPETSERILKQIKTRKSEPLFPRIEK
ncbi:MAG: class I tRNA ligase family protein [Candidatus Pacebacteria bacterium]|nr:class I tRNA ligase family protein [Candidatus Paceibacterota bacterium]